MQYSCDSILIRALLIKFRSAYWSRVILGGVSGCDVLYGGSAMCDKVTEGGGQNWSQIAWRTLWTAPKRPVRARRSLGDLHTLDVHVIFRLEFQNTAITHMTCDDCHKQQTTNHCRCWNTSVKCRTVSLESKSFAFKEIFWNRGTGSHNLIRYSTPVSCSLCAR